MSSFKETRYLPIDISKGAIEVNTSYFRLHYSQVKVQGIVADYFQGLHQAHMDSDRPKMILFLGSTIGNMPHQEALSFLKQLHKGMLPEDRLLIGMDLQKEISIINIAYNDPLGITAAFTKNALLHINTEVGSNFDLGDFSFASYYDETYNRVCLGVTARQNVVISFPSSRSQISIKQGETVITEYSHKYAPRDISDIAEYCGFTPDTAWTDEKNHYQLNLWRPHV